MTRGTLLPSDSKLISIPKSSPSTDSLDGQILSVKAGKTVLNRVSHRNASRSAGHKEEVTVAVAAQIVVAEEQTKRQLKLRRTETEP